MEIVDANFLLYFLRVLQIVAVGAVQCNVIILIIVENTWKNITFLRTVHCFAKRFYLDFSVSPCKTIKPVAISSLSRLFTSTQESNMR